MVLDTINTLAEFLSRVAEIKAEHVAAGHKDDLLFRSQPCDKPLLPRLGRVRTKGPRNKIERLMLDKFDRASLPFREFEPKDEWDLLTSRTTSPAADAAARLDIQFHCGPVVRGTRSTDQNR